MKRRLFNLAAIVSMVLCLGTGLLWGRSYWRSDCFSYGVAVDEQAGRFRAASVFNGRGGLMLANNSVNLYPPPEPTVTNSSSGWFHYSDRPRSPIASPGFGTIDYSRDMFGFGTRRWHGTSRSVYTSEYKITTMATTQSGVFVPHWFMAIVFALLPILQIRRAFLLRRVRIRRQRGLCGICGYDLRASPARCPECGTEVEVRMKAEG